MAGSRASTNKADLRGECCLVAAACKQPWFVTDRRRHQSSGQSASDAWWIGRPQWRWQAGGHTTAIINHTRCWTAPIFHATIVKCNESHTGGLICNFYCRIHPYVNHSSLQLCIKKKSFLWTDVIWHTSCDPLSTTQSVILTTSHQKHFQTAAVPGSHLKVSPKALSPTPEKYSVSLVFHNQLLSQWITIL